jgi:excisionase family DNA binding protein
VTPGESRDVLVHVAAALARYAREGRTDGIAVPPEINALADLLVSGLSVRTRQQPTEGALGPGGPDAGLMTSLMLTIRETAGALRCSTRTVERLVAAGELRAVKVAGATRIRRGDLDAFIAALSPRAALSFRDRVDVKDTA